VVKVIAQRHGDTGKRRRVRNEEMGFRNLKKLLTPNFSFPLCLCAPVRVFI